MSKLNHAKVNMRERIAHETRNEYAADAHAGACMRGALYPPRTRKRPTHTRDMDSFIAARIADAQATRKEHAC